MSEDYDRQENRRLLQLAESTGFVGNKFVYDRSHQLCLDSMDWVTADELGESPVSC